MESHTTLVALNLQDHTLGILAAESRESNRDYGETMNDNADKITRIYPNVYVACSGNSQLISEVECILKMGRNPHHPPADMNALAVIVRDEVNLLVGDAPLDEDEKPRAVHIYLMGTLNDVKIQLFEILRVDRNSRSHGYRELPGDSYATGSGADGVRDFFINNMVTEGFSLGDLDFCNGSYLAMEAVRHAIAMDPLSGGFIKVVVLRFGFAPRIEIWIPNDPTSCKSYYSINVSEEVPMEEDATTSTDSVSDSG